MAAGAAAPAAAAAGLQVALEAPTGDSLYVVIVPFTTFD